MNKSESPSALAEMLGHRLRQARLNANVSQEELAKRAGVSRNAVLRAEAGKTQLETFLALLAALDLVGQLTHLLPEQPISPLQLLKLHGQRRQRAGGPRERTQGKGKQETPEW